MLIFGISEIISYEKYRKNKELHNSANSIISSILEEEVK